MITFEGGEGSGKSTQAGLLAAHLREHGREAVLTQEPRGTEFGLRCWQLLARGLDPASELMIFAAARSHHVRTLVAPALARGAIVVCDRYSDSTIAYQRYGRGLDAEMVERACRYAEGGVTPALTFLLDLPPEIGLKRKGEAVEEDAISAEALDFHRRVRQGYLALADAHPTRIHVLDATIEPALVAEAIAERSAAASQR